MNHLTEGVHTGVGPAASDHGHGVVRHFGQAGLDRFLDARKKVLTPFLDFLALPSTVIPSDVGNPERVLHTRQISKRNPA